MTTAPARRHAAGTDPAKRAQILDGALEVFLERGFHAASMREICRAAGVSKGTLYVYFTDKEELFQALIETRRDRKHEVLTGVLNGPAPVAEKLADYGRVLAQTLTSREVVRFQRIIIGLVDGIEGLGPRFYDIAKRRTLDDLTALLTQAVADGTMDIPDIELATHQFAEMTTAGLWRPRLFGSERTPPDMDRIEATVASAVRMFMAGYGRATGG
ncbi:TetR/AcrR family transcriptional regulator [Falsirhodobacter algicola]|uniref:TetR family transcriptional regulator n=1 Tax=Falsirhodobacter algicola TaxID=2692330 RepID=A0A8J8SLK6_9RHOB|nr:TetR/AcrR family transcriptional regulator [Falsirhodobacter algicola]QUS36461.1 TetR family transcriptional regulator [Falsirhodobacter algicola]